MKSHSARLSRAPFGALPDGTRIDLFTLTNARGTEARVITYGGIIVSLRTADRQGTCADVVLGHDTLDAYVADSPYFGAIIGRCGNRIANGRFTLDGREQVLATNNGPNHLHGGVRGFDKVAWHAEPFERSTGVGVELRYTSRDGEEGYPGKLETLVRYTLSDRNELAIDYRATTDAPTVVNLTQHSYFNLTGDPTRDVLGHQLTLLAGHYTPVTETLIPTGEIARVAGTPFDFRVATPIGARIGAEHEQLRHAGGYDHNFVLDHGGRSREPAPAARVVEPSSGRRMEVFTTEPGVQFYSGNFLDGSVRGKNGVPCAHRTGFCLEAQHFPDSPNQPAFPSVVLRPGSEYRSRTVYTFGIQG